MGDVSINRPIKAEPGAGGISQGDRILGLVSAGWTDESHMLYISSMETSFIEQLKKQEQKVNHNDSNGKGFKVLRGGAWEKLNFERSNACSPKGSKYCVPANPWIQHFRSRSRRNRAGSDNLVGDLESGIQTVQGKTPLSHGREWEACEGEKTLAENTEVSDQNFADDEADIDAESSQARKKRKLSSAFTRKYEVISQD